MKLYQASSFQIYVFKSFGFNITHLLASISQSKLLACTGADQGYLPMMAVFCKAPGRRSSLEPKVAGLSPVRSCPSGSSADVCALLGLQEAHNADCVNTMAARFASCSRTVWPSGLRRWLQAPVRKGVGSHPTAVTFSNDCLELFAKMMQWCAKRSFMS